MNRPNCFGIWPTHIHLVHRYTVNGTLSRDYPHPGYRTPPSHTGQFPSSCHPLRGTARHTLDPQSGLRVQLELLHAMGPWPSHRPSDLSVSGDFSHCSIMLPHSQNRTTTVLSIWGPSDLGNTHSTFPLPDLFHPRLHKAQVSWI